MGEHADNLTDDGIASLFSDEWDGEEPDWDAVLDLMDPDSHTHPRSHPMPAPKVRPLNPDALALLETLLHTPDRAECPICGEVGFWDNRNDPKRPEKAPHWKCKNKDCPGATPLKGKRPYGVWLPDDYVEPQQAPSKRLPPPPRAEVPGHDPEAPLIGDGGLDGPEGDGEAIPAAMSTRREVYFALARQVAAFQAELGKEYEMPFDASSVNAMTFSIFNQR